MSHFVGLLNKILMMEGTFLLKDSSIRIKLVLCSGTIDIKAGIKPVTREILVDLH